MHFKFALILSMKKRPTLKWGLWKEDYESQNYWEDCDNSKLLCNFMGSEKKLNVHEKT